ncbi:MAG: CoA-binding protein [Bacteroidales bacterium]
MNEKKEKKTLVIGASENPERYAYKAVVKLMDNDYPVVAFGLRDGSIHGLDITTEFPTDTDIHTITLYVGIRNQPEYYDRIISLKPKRVIFNPGTENTEFEDKLNDLGIEAFEACTLVMLASKQY